MVDSQIYYRQHYDGARKKKLGSIAVAGVKLVKHGKQCKLTATRLPM